MYRTHEDHPQGEDRCHAGLVAEIARYLKPSFYLEIGCETGITFEKVEPYCMKAVALDIKESCREHLYMRGLADHFVCASSLDYITNLDNESVDLCFIDSSHEEEMTVREFAALAPKMMKNGVVLMHDSYPPNREFLRPDRCGGVWRAVERLRREQSYFEFVTLPCQYGLTIARKSFGKQVLWQ